MPLYFEAVVCRLPFFLSFKYVMPKRLLFLFSTYDMIIRVADRILFRCILRKFNHLVSYLATERVLIINI